MFHRAEHRSLSALCCNVSRGFKHFLLPGVFKKKKEKGTKLYFLFSDWGSGEEDECRSPIDDNLYLLFSLPVAWNCRSPLLLGFYPGFTCSIFNPTVESDVPDGLEDLYLLSVRTLGPCLSNIYDLCFFFFKKACQMYWATSFNSTANYVQEKTLASDHVINLINQCSGQKETFTDSPLKKTSCITHIWLFLQRKNSCVESNYQQCNVIMIYTHMNMD